MKGADMAGERFIELREEKLRKIAALTEHAGYELSEMHQKCMDVPSANLEFFPHDIYRIAATLEMLAQEINNEADWYRELQPQAEKLAA